MEGVERYKKLSRDQRAKIGDDAFRLWQRGREAVHERRHVEGAAALEKRADEMYELYEACNFDGAVTASWTDLDVPDVLPAPPFPNSPGWRNT